MEAALPSLRRWTPAQIVALAFGIWWIGNGVAVFLSISPAATALDTSGEVDVFGAFSIAVNGWHGVLHLLTGAAGIASCWRARTASAYALGMGILYLTAAIYSLFAGATVFGLVRVDALGSADHAAEGVLLLLVWLNSHLSSPDLNLHTTRRSQL